MTISGLRYARVLVPAAVCCLALASCGKQTTAHPGVSPAEGRIMLNGRPLAGAVLVFHAKEKKPGPAVPTPGAVSGDDGRFVVSTYQVGDGLPPGSYRVTVSCEDHTAKKVRDEYPELLPPRYQLPDKSGLEVTIVEGRNELTLPELKR